ncbi:MAG TPA: glycerol-3-phosphate 1-O-acyltransferase PlsY [Coprothermobacter proteolyticus]|nr:glycerol-3-phosphate 1-O-acyltransferase PlsY [Coprothermobacter proteolyticus]
MNYYYLLGVVGAYLYGAMPFGYLIALSKGVDIRKIGSGNIGTTNVYRALGVVFGAMTLLLDLSKGFIPSYLAFHYFSGLTPLQQWLLFLAPIIGHCFSVFLRFKGGKGVATSVGALLGFDIRLVLMFVAVWLVTFLPTRWVSLGSILGIWSVFIFAFAILPFFPWALLFLAFFITWRHKDNIRRLMAGSENKTFLPWEQKKAAAGNS